MGNLVFQATLGGQVNLVGPNTASTFNLNVPAVSSTISTTSGTETLTNKTLTTPVINGFTGDTSVVNIGSGQFYKDTSGNLGLGVTPSAWDSTFKSQEIGAVGNSFAGQSGASQAVLSSNAYYNGGWKYARSTLASQFALAGGQSIWYTAASGTAGNAISFTQAMTLDASGNLGVGTTSPNKAGVGKAISVSSTSYALLEANYNDARAGYLFSVSGGTYVGDTRAQPLIFTTTDAERARIDSSGNLLVGTTTAINSSAKVNVYNTSGGNGGLAIGYGSGSGANRLMYLISSNGGLYFESSANAAYLNSAGAWTNASDARLKNSIEDIKYGLSAVLSTQPRSYKMNDLEGDYIGFVAQELQTVIPEVVSGDPEKQLGVDYGSLVAVAFKAIQELAAASVEQQAIITQLQADVAALKGQA